MRGRVAHHVSRRAHHSGARAEAPLRYLVCGGVKAMGLSDRPAIHRVRRTAHVCAILEAHLKAGHRGLDGSKRRTRAEERPVLFRADAAQPFGDRCLS
ncbi:hypothetical protein [Nocardiopsis sp. CNT312]|uniref:hypothetical protein n=1 Tax=Nocardiopsis sp. CNT312 TaxID=1137268 RepID=UPI00048B000B|nr:hypothetical protein [Nocardiopsis sp. CNT312]